jgi:hypothetical protein
MKALIRTVGMLAVIGALHLSAPAAEAQELCVLRQSAVAELAAQYDEQVVGRGLAQGGKAMVELFVSGTGTWTAVVTDTHGRSCVIASGVSWSALPLIVGDPA